MTTLDAMEKYGGSFVKALAKCYIRADSSNAQKLITAFSEIFERYRKTAYAETEEVEL